jgi:2-hydroxy-3-keto-5-methylthiopentenyl-1-phosphate phosphatase
MDCLYGFEGGFHKDIIGDALQKVFRKEALSKEEIFEIIKISLRVGIKDFLDYSKRIQLPKN